ncbi:Peptidase M15 [Rubritalea squalenifaciens DSM 18772]|uniref:Peptidase M15 n=1 Tax=Rubritalea squalenifaciens DSM 18772 TaxID=1123071 RepID=A0A1M6MDG5_9BACT|nr:D-Ala-D-Ala carboxypeptidase family metallohydrolase [Rubritalea squalenifaciens]SHJ81313.1 Peptidase M15 [Rubritalea squalenifaciens DSM 18772]
MRNDTITSEGTLRKVGRRRFLGLLTAFGSGLLMAAQEAKAGLFYSTKSVEGIPQSWVNQKGLDVLRYANYIKGLKLKNVTPRMVLKPHFKTRGRTTNSLPPRHMWSHIAGTLRVIDKLAARLNAPVDDLLSIYRSPQYNRAVRGRSRSQHMENRAVDVKFRGVSAWTVSSNARKLRNAGLFKGGVGRYSSFTHIDTRGHNAEWGF